MKFTSTNLLSIFAILTTSVFLSACQTYSTNIDNISNYSLGYNEFSHDSMIKDIESCLTEEKCYKSKKFKSVVSSVVSTSFRRGEPEKLVEYGVIEKLSEKFDPIRFFTKSDLISYKGYDLTIIDLKNRLLIESRDYSELYTSLSEEIKRNKDEKTVQRDSRIIRSVFFHLGCKSEFDVWGNVNSDYDPLMFSSAGNRKSKMQDTMTETEYKKNSLAILYRDFDEVRISDSCKL